MLAVTLPVRLHNNLSSNMDSLENIVQLYGELDEVPASLTEKIHNEMKALESIYDQYAVLCLQLGEPVVL